MKKSEKSSLTTGGSSLAPGGMKISDSNWTTVGLLFFFFFAFSPEASSNITLYPSFTFVDSIKPWRPSNSTRWPFDSFKTLVDIGIRGSADRKNDARLFGEA